MHLPTEDVAYTMLYLLSGIMTNKLHQCGIQREVPVTQELLGKYWLTMRDNMSREFFSGTRVKETEAMP